MAMEAWDGYRQRLADCPHCGNTSPHRELAWASTHIADPVSDAGESVDFDYYTFFAQCGTCGRTSVYGAIEDDSFEDATLDWPKPRSAPAKPDPEVGYLAAATELLASRGEAQAASLLVDVLGLNFAHVTYAYKGDDTANLVRAALLVEPSIVDRYTPEVIELVRGALTDAAWGDRVAVQDVDVVPVVAEGDWRERVEKTLGLGPSNQAGILPPREKRPRADRLDFASDAELAVYLALRDRQDGLPANDTILIAPNAGVRVKGSTISPDFLVTYRGRVGAIEVDGPSHRGKWANDRSRDQLLEDGGVAYVLRVTVEETADPDALARLVDRLLGRLAA